MKKYIVLALLVASCACAQIMPGIIDSQRNLPGWLSDVNFTCPVFNSVNQYATAGASGLPAASSPVTIMLWVKQSRLTSGQDCIYQYGQSAATLTSCLALQYHSTYKWCLRFGLTIVYGSPAFADAVGNWNNIAFTYPGRGASASSSIMYVNGLPRSVAVVTDSVPSLIASQSGIGTGLTFTSGSVAGSLAELAIWSRALSLAEIAYYMPKRLSGREPGLVALYHMSDGNNVATQTLIDSVGGKHATMYNSVPWTPRRGYGANASDVRSAQYALSFDGSNDVASGANAAITGYPYTLEGWMFTPALAAGSESILISIASSSLASGTYCGAINKATVYNQMAGRDTTRLDVASSTFAKWVHVAMVASASNLMLLYQNGVQIGTDTTDKPFLPNFDKLSIGAIRAATTIYRPGSFADVRIWNTARTPAEINDNMYQVQTGSETGLCYYWKINEGTGTTLNNLGSAGAAGNLTLIGPTWIRRSIP